MSTAPVEDRTERRQTWWPLAEQLSTLPVTITNLLREHVADDRGMCAECTSAGTGLHQTPAPCSIRRLAEAAQRIAEQQR